MKLDIHITRYIGQHADVEMDCARIDSIAATARHGYGISQVRSNVKCGHFVNLVSCRHLRGMVIKVIERI